MTQQQQERAEADDRASAAPAGLVRALAIVGAALSLVFYLLGFVSDVGTTGLVGALVIGGGLLAGVGVLPRAGRLLAPAAVVSTVGVLALLQVVVSTRATALLVGALAVAVLQTVAVVGALLADAGILGAPSRRPKQPAPADENAPYGAVSPDQAWTQEHLGRLHQVGAPGGDPTMAYGMSPGGAAPQQYAGLPDNTALIAAPASGAFPVGEPGSVPAFGLSGAPAPKDATEVVPASAYGAVPAPSPSAPGEAGAPAYGITGATAMNGAAAGERGQAPGETQAAAYGPVSGAAGVERGQAPGDAPLYGLAGAAAVNGAAAGERGQTPGDAQLYGLTSAGAAAANGATAGERGQAPGDAQRYGLTGAGAANGGATDQRGQAPGDAQPPMYGATGAGAANRAAERGPAPADAQLSGSGGGSANGAAAAQALGEGQVPLYGLSGASAVNSVQTPEHGPSGASHSAAGEVPAPLYGLSGRGASGTGGQRGPAGQTQNGAADPSAARFGAGESGHPGQFRGAPGERSAPQYGLPGANMPDERVTTSGPAHAVPTDGPALLQGLTGPARAAEPGSAGTPGVASPLYGASGPDQAGSPGEHGRLAREQNGGRGASAAQHGLSGERGQAYGPPGEQVAPQYGQPGAANERGWSGYTSPGETHGPTGAAGARGQAHNGDGSGQLSGLSGTGAPGNMNGRASTSGPSHGVPGESAAPLFGSANGANAAAVGGPYPQGEAPLYGLSGVVVPNAGGTGSAPAYGQPGPGASRPGSGSSGAHHAPTGELPQYGAPVSNGAVTSNPGVHLPGAGDSAQPNHGRPTPGVPNGRPAPSPTGSHWEASSPRPGSAPAGRDASGDGAPIYGLSGATPSHPAMRPPDVTRGNPNIGPETTAFRVQRAWAESEATPAMGQASSSNPDATMVAAPGWLAEVEGAADPSKPPEQGGQGRAGRHGSPRGGRHGQPDDGRPDPTQVFPNPER